MLQKLWAIERNRFEILHFERSAILRIIIRSIFFSDKINTLMVYHRYMHDKKYKIYNKLIQNERIGVSRG